MAVEAKFADVPHALWQRVERLLPAEAGLAAVGRTCHLDEFSPESCIG